jgi:L-arabinose isomerase
VKKKIAKQLRQRKRKIRNRLDKRTIPEHLGPMPDPGNTNTRGFFKPDVRSFLKNWVAEGPTHHLGLGVGHHARTIQQIAEILNLESVIVTPEDK